MTVYDASDNHLARRLQSSPAEGAIVTIISPSQARQLRRVTKPMVNTVTDWKCHIPVIRWDDLAVGRMAAEHLIERGLRQLFYVGIAESASTERWNGFRDTAASGGATVHYGGPAGITSSGLGVRFRSVGRDAADRTITLNPRAAAPAPHAEDAVRQKPKKRADAVPESWTWSQLLDSNVMNDFARSLPPQSGVMCFNDIVSQHVVEACERTGRAVPNDVAVIGVDNDRLRCVYGAVTLSSVDLGLMELGRQAARVLVDLIAGREVPQLLKITPRGLVVRQSTDVLVVARPELRVALQFIRENACRAITSSDVVEHVALSRSTLDRELQAATGRSIGAEIRRVRLTEAARLVRTTDLRMEQVARQAGFSSQQNLSRAYRLAFGTSPVADRSAQPRLDKVRDDERTRPN